jgi:hypothetical protein
MVLLVVCFASQARISRGIDHPIEIDAGLVHRPREALDMVPSGNEVHVRAETHPVHRTL